MSLSPPPPLPKISQIPVAVPLLLSSLMAVTARGDAPKRYGDAVARVARSSLAARAEEAAERLGRKLGMVVDARLEAALDALVPHLPESGPPDEAVTERALWLSGLVEPSPYLLTMTVPKGADDDALHKVSEMVPDMLAHGHYVRLAAATSALGDGGVRLVLALQESDVKLAPVPRSAATGADVVLDGALVPPYGSAGLFVTAPDGNVTRPALVAGLAPGRFHGSFRCGEKPGAWQVEVVGEDRFGEAVLANFPVYCGVPAPAVFETPDLAAMLSTAHSSSLPTDPTLLRAAAEERALRLIAADRKRASLPELAIDPGLSAVARLHSEDMRDHHFFGHVSPTTGTAMNRLSDAKVTVLRVRENLGRAYTPEELERGLMGSPSHRANLLAADVERVGVGIAVGEPASGSSGSRDLYLTQLFAHFPAAFETARADATLRSRLELIRKDAKLPVLVADAALDRVAREVAQGFADGTLSPEHPTKNDPVSRALPGLAARFKWVRKVSALALDVSQFTSSPALLDKNATHAGVAAVQVPSSKRSTATAASASAGEIFVVVLLAAQRVVVVPGTTP